MLDHPSCKLRVPFHLRGNRVQRIEEKMRIELHSERVKTSLGEVHFETLETQHSGNIVIVIAICLPGSQNQPVDEPVPEKHALQRINQKPDARQPTPLTHPERGANCLQKIDV